MLYWILGAVCLLLLILLFSPIRIRVCYENGVQTRLRYLFVSLLLYPRKEKRVRAKDFTNRRLRRKMRRLRRKKPKASAQAPVAATQEKKQISDWVAFGKDLYNAFAVIPKTLLRRMKIRLARVRIGVTAEDAASCALLTGVVTEGVRATEQLLLENLSYARCKDAQVCVYPAYIAKEPEIVVRVELRLRLLHAIGIAIQALMCYLGWKNRKKNQT